MGGGAFLNARADDQPTLQTPRISADDYARLRNIYTERLGAYFGSENVTTLIEAPEKLDYGDIDIFISSDEIIDWADMAAKIGAEAWLDRGSDKSQKCSLAVRLDGERSTDSPVHYVLTHHNDTQKRKPSDNFAEESYAQIDLERIAIGQKDWSAFYGSYGDLAGMLGNAVTNFGFDVTDRGLRLRLQELDDSGWGEWEHFRPPLEEGRLLLSSDPIKIMEFFGLSVERYDAGFMTEEELFQWLGDCRMISKISLKRERSEAARDKQKASRGLFKRFFGEWMPSHLEVKKSGNEQAEDDNDKGVDDNTHSSPIPHLREQYLDEALNFFDKKESLESLRAAFLRKRANETAAARLRTIIAKHSNKKGPKLAELARAFRRNVAFRDGQPVFLAEQKSDVESELYSFLDESGKELQSPEIVDEWVRENFDQVKEIERERTKKKTSGTKEG